MTIRQGVSALALATAVVGAIGGLAFAAPAATYQVQPGDTLTSIARATKTTVPAIVAANNLTNPNVITVGQTLALNQPASSTPQPASSATTCPGFAVDTQDIVRHVLVACPSSATSALAAEVTQAAAEANPAPKSTAAPPASPVPANKASIPAPTAPTANVVKTLAVTPSPPASLLAPPYHSQFDGSAYAETNCGPTSLSMALGALGINVDQETLRILANTQMGTSDPNSGTTWASLVYAAQKEGASVVGPYQGSGASQRSWTIADLEAQVTQGHPVIALVYYRDLPGNASSPFTSDHYIVVYSVDAKGSLIYNDPAFRNNGGAHLTISPDALTKAWTNTSESLVRTAIALSK